MGFIGGLLGLNGGTNGTGQNLTAGTDQGQLAQANTLSNKSLQSQQALLQALQGQGGMNNQSQVYNQLQGVANGTGPNPAQAMLNQATGQNVANQSALMAGQRGAGANVGLLARQAAQQGAGIQQNAAGQAATMQANQSLNALGQAGNLANQMANQQIGQTNAAAASNQAQQGMLQNANSQYNQIQGNLANTNMQGQQGVLGGVLGGVGAALGLSQGGTISPNMGLEVPGYSDGGSTDDSNSSSSFGKYFSSMGGQNNALQSGISGLIGGLGSVPGKINNLFSSSNANGLTMPDFGSQFQGQAPTLGLNTSFTGQAQPSQAPSLGSNLTYQAASFPQYASGGNVGQKLKAGGKVPGHAKVAGNSPKNDTVKAALSPGEGVIDRETMAHPGDVGDAARFVMAYVNSKKRSK